MTLLKALSHVAVLGAVLLPLAARAQSEQPAGEPAMDQSMHVPQATEQPTGMPAPAEPATGQNFIVSGTKADAAWHYVMGPMPITPETALRLDGQGTGGRLTFICTQTGDADFDLVLWSPPGGLPDHVVATVTVGRLTHTLDMNLNAEPTSDGGRFYEAHGWAVGSILSAMSVSDPGAWVKAELSPSLVVTAQIPDLQSVPATVGALCSAWVSKAHPEIVPTGGGHHA